MDVERIQKINNLALDLMRQGLAKDREEAIQQAEKIFRGEQSGDYSDIRERMDTRSEAPQQASVDLSEDKIKEIMEKNTQFLVKKINEFQEKLNNMHSEIQTIKNKVDYHNIPTVKEILAEAKKEQQAQQQAAPQQQQTEAAEPAPQQQEAPAQPPKQDPTKDHPRSGNYKDDDVSIEKFFYMGSK
jgi:hypothetical protein